MRRGLKSLEGYSCTYVHDDPAPVQGVGRTGRASLGKRWDADAWQYRTPGAQAGFWEVGPLVLHRRPGGRVSPAPALTLSQRQTLLASWGFLSFEEGEQGISSFTSCTISSVAFCEDSARQPGRRP